MQGALPMKSTYSTAMRRGVFPHEGGYTNHPSDPGGPTNFGITLADYRKYVNASGTAEDVRRMAKSTAEDIYRKHYAKPLRYDDLPAGVDYAVLDYGINSGIGRSGKVLRRVCGLSDSDWHVTDDVLAAVAKRNPQAVIIAICDERLRFLKQLRTWPVFGAGWGRRVSEVRALALNFASAPESATMSNSPAPGKAVIPPSTTEKKAAAGTAGAGATAGAATWFDWVTSHPYASTGIAAAIVVGLALVFMLIDRRHRAQQEAPTPNLIPVPAK